MELRYAGSPKDVKQYSTDRIREDFLVQKLFRKGQTDIVISSTDRMIIGSSVPCDERLPLKNEMNTGTEYFLDERELGIINIGGNGSVIADGREYSIKYLEGMYVGRGTKEVIFLSEDAARPAKFYFNSAPAHRDLPTVKISLDEAKECGTVEISSKNKVRMGCVEQSNQRAIIKYILPGQVESCQLVMGMTVLETGSVWNTMPCHTHMRRMEVYLYFDMDENDLVMHYMGEPNETRHIVVRNEEAVISPEWSIHAGCGTKRYSFIWGMAGENKDFSDMIQIQADVLK